METIKGLKRSFMCGHLNRNHIGTNVTLFGWVAKSRNLGAIIFTDIRDRTGILQIRFDSEHTTLFEKADTLKAEFVVAISGQVVLRDSINPKIPTGEVEVVASELRILNAAKTPPFVIANEVTAKEELRLKYRYLDLRRPTLADNLIMRHNITKCARDYFYSQGFLELETPILTKSTPEGARDYLVPSRVFPGKFYALPQSPQQYKQLLMLAGMDRYIQIARCFRDEDLRADRQPEFTQIDLEMSFVDEEDVMTVNEGFMSLLFQQLMDIHIPLPIPRLTYQQAMDTYGSDKPDLRFGLEISDISDLLSSVPLPIYQQALENNGTIRCIKAKAAHFSRKMIDALSDTAKLYKANGITYIALTDNGVKSSITKFLDASTIDNILHKMDMQTGDMLVIVAGETASTLTALGALRLELAKKLDLIKPGQYKLLWVTDFPLFEKDEDGRLKAMHHPFTAPKDNCLDLLEGNPTQALAKAYDLVLNGTELGGGSIRIYDSQLQLRMFRALGFTPEQATEQFGHLMEAFSYGAPPHGGMAYGLDRLVMLLRDQHSIRDVIPFPKVQTAAELMMESPSHVSPEQLRELELSINQTERNGE